LRQLIDEIGKRSAIAQGLVRGGGQPAPVTSFGQMLQSSHRLYMCIQRTEQGRHVLGLLKVGCKQLYHWDSRGSLRELNNHMSVLDFYVDEACQRQGVGIRLFRHVLESEGSSPEKLAYDRPSPKLLAFLHKHYGLRDYTPQKNNFVIYNEFFASRPPPKGSIYDTISSRPLTARNGPPSSWAVRS